MSIVQKTGGLKSSAKGLLGALLSFCALVQIPAVHDLILTLAHDHPHVTSIFGTLFAIAAVLMNPECEKVLGITHEDPQ